MPSKEEALLVLERLAERFSLAAEKDVQRAVVYDELAMKEAKKAEQCAKSSDSRGLHDQRLAELRQLANEWRDRAQWAERQAEKLRSKASASRKLQ